MTEKKTAVGYLKKTVYSISDRSHRIPELFITSLRRAVCVGVELYFVFRLCEGKRKKKKKPPYLFKFTKLPQARFLPTWDTGCRFLQSTDKLRSQDLPRFNLKRKTKLKKQQSWNNCEFKLLNLEHRSYCEPQAFRSFNYLFDICAHCCSTISVCLLGDIAAKWQYLGWIILE